MKKATILLNNICEPQFREFYDCEHLVITYDSRIVSTPASMNNLWFYLQECKALKKLSLKIIKSKDTIEYLQELPEEKKRLLRLQLQALYIQGNAETTLLPNDVCYVKMLKSLTLDSCHSYSSNEIRELFQMCESLEVLRIHRYCGVFDCDALLPLFDRGHLEVFRLSDVPRVQNEHVLSLLSDLPSLRVLILINVGIDKLPEFNGHRQTVDAEEITSCTVEHDHRDLLKPQGLDFEVHSFVEEQTEKQESEEGPSCSTAPMGSTVKLRSYNNGAHEINGGSKQYRSFPSLQKLIINSVDGYGGSFDQLLYIASIDVRIVEVCNFFEVWTLYPITHQFNTWRNLRSLVIHNCEEIRDWEALVALECCTVLEAISINKCIHMQTLKWLEVLENCKYLRAIEFINCPNIEDLDDFEKLSACTELQTLHLSDMRNLRCSLGLCVLKSWPKLQTLRLSKMPMIKNLDALFSIQHCRDLKEFRVSDMKRLQNIEFLIGVSACSQLRFLYLYDLPGVKEVKPLGCLSDCPSLNELHVGFAEDVSDISWARSVSNCVFLEKLTIINFDIIDPSLFISLNRCSYLKKIDMIGCVVNPKHMVFDSLFITNKNLQINLSLRT